MCQLAQAKPRRKKNQKLQEGWATHKWGNTSAYENLPKTKK
jgi:hypothetical protein